MPTVRPRTSRLWPAKDRPPLSERRKLSAWTAAPASRRPLPSEAREPPGGAGRPAPPPAADRGQVPDDDGGDEEGQRVEVDREVDLVDVGSDPLHPPAERRQYREDERRRDRRQPVRGDE